MRNLLSPEDRHRLDKRVDVDIYRAGHLHEDKEYRMPSFSSVVSDAFVLVDYVVEQCHIFLGNDSVSFSLDRNYDGSWYAGFVLESRKHPYDIETDIEILESESGSQMCVEIVYACLDTHAKMVEIFNSTRRGEKHE